MDIDHLPTTDQIIMASEWPVLAALDTLLALTIRTLLAEHATLEPIASPDGEPENPAQALAASTIILARSLQHVVANYCYILERHSAGCRHPHDDDILF